MDLRGRKDCDLRIQTTDTRRDPERGRMKAGNAVVSEFLFAQVIEEFLRRLRMIQQWVSQLPVGISPPGQAGVTSAT